MRKILTILVINISLLLYTAVGIAQGPLPAADVLPPAPAVSVDAVPLPPVDKAVGSSIAEAIPSVDKSPINILPPAPTVKPIDNNKRTRRAYSGCPLRQSLKKWRAAVRDRLDKTSKRLQDRRTERLAQRQAKKAADDDKPATASPRGFKRIKDSK
jgi:hypothetical protein